MRIDTDTCRDPDLLAAEVRRLRGVISASQTTLTDDERAAVSWCVEMALRSATDCVDEIRTLRSLLERL